MKTTATVLQVLVRVIGPIMLILGVLFWTGNAESLIPLHMLLGVALVLLLWALAVLGAVAGVQPGFVALALVWGLIVPILGVTQFGLQTGSLHWIVQVAHLLVGLGAIGMADSLARRVKRQRAARDAARPTSALGGVARWRWR